MGKENARFGNAYWLMKMHHVQYHCSACQQPWDVGDLIPILQISTLRLGPWRETGWANQQPGVLGSGV